MDSFSIVIVVKNTPPTSFNVSTPIESIWIGRFNTVLLEKGKLDSILSFIPGCTRAADSGLQIYRERAVAVAMDCEWPKFSQLLQQEDRVTRQASASLARHQKYKMRIDSKTAHPSGRFQG